MLPTDTFDPSDQAVVFFGRQLSAVPRVVRGWTDRRAGAVRVRLGAAGEGRMVYSLEVPARSRSALRAAAGAYDEVELRPSDEVDLVGATSLRLEPEEEGEDGLSRQEPARARTADTGDEADELAIDESEVLDETPELSPWWEGDPGPEDRS